MLFCQEHDKEKDDEVARVLRIIVEEITLESEIEMVKETMNESKKKMRK